jgi:hypothetical protein
VARLDHGFYVANGTAFSFIDECAQLALRTPNKWRMQSRFCPSGRQQHVFDVKHRELGMIPARDRKGVAKRSLRVIGEVHWAEDLVYFHVGTSFLPI